MSQDFEVVRRIGLALPGVESLTKYDGSPVLKVDGVFVAGLAMHASAEPGTLVVRAKLDERALFLEEAPETYYLTEYYRSFPVVLVRLAHVREDALRDLLAVSWRMAKAKGKRRKRVEPL